MTMTVNMYEAKTHFSHLVGEAERGADVVIARNGKPAVRLVPVEAPAKRELGFLEGPISDESNAALLAPLDDDEIALWENGDLIAKP